MQERQFRALLDFADIVDHDLRSWFYRERTRAMVLSEEEFSSGALLLALHAQFHLPLPDKLEGPNGIVEI